MAKKPLVSVPETSVLKNVQRKGREGSCVACGKPIHTHLGNRGVWVGCVSDQVPDNATFILVPSTFPANRPAKVPVVSQDRGIAVPVKSNERRSVAYAGPRYVYAATDKRKRHIEATPAIQHTYEALLKAKHPVTVQEAAKLADAPVEANRVRLNMLTMAGLVTKTEVTENGE